MSEKEPEQVYPVKTLHDFLSEINKEWRRFKRGTLTSLFFLTVMLATFVPLFVRAVRYEWDIIMYVFLIGLAAFLIYSIRIMVLQYRFFRKWDLRREQLVNLEEQLMNEKPSDASQSG
jgi:hypothetical protein